MKFRNALIATIFLIAACSSTTGRQISDTDLKSLTVGRSTVSDAMAKLGQPTESSTDAKGIQTLTYIYAHSVTRPETFIPFAGAFVGGADSQTATVQLMFDKNGLLTNYTNNTGNLGTTMGK